jgi:Flp pilus assembly protein TadD
MARFAGLAVFCLLCARAQDGTDLRAAWEKAPTQEATAFPYSRFLLQREQFAEAAGVLEEASKANPTNPQLALALGVAYYGLRRFGDAADQFLLTARLAPDVEQPYLFLGRMLDQTGPRLPEIARRTAQWAKAHPEDSRGPVLQAKILMAGETPDPKQAEALLRRALRLDERNAEAHYELGVLLEDRREFSEAETHLVRAIELRPRDAAAYYHLARVYDRLGKPQEAKEARVRHGELTRMSSLR